jgi:hemerythrin-like domain-containing protein
MIEHRLIEKVIAVMKAQLELIQAEKRVDPGLVEKLIHFVKAYADRCHHGKEEEILFRELTQKNLSSEHKRILKELVEEHRFGRKIVSSLAEANQRYREGDTAALSSIADGLRSLLEFYPGHIRKEDKDFFMPVMDYFSAEEKDAILKEGYELDSRLMHEEYEDLVRIFD